VPRGHSAAAALGADAGRASAPAADGGHIPGARSAGGSARDCGSISACPGEDAARAVDGRAAVPTAGGFPDANFYLDQGRIASQSFENEHLPVIGGCIDIGQGKEKGGGTGKKGPLSAQQLVFRNLCGNFAKNHQEFLKTPRLKAWPKMAFC